MFSDYTQTNLTRMYNKLQVHRPTITAPGNGGSGWDVKETGWDVKGTVPVPHATMRPGHLDLERPASRPVVPHNGAREPRPERALCSIQHSLVAGGHRHLASNLHGAAFDGRNRKVRRRRAWASSLASHEVNLTPTIKAGMQHRLYDSLYEFPP